jgi:hypothetical protein
MAQRVSVYPNPFYDSTTVHFQLNSKGSIIELFDLKGRIIAKWFNNDKDFVVSDESLKQGIYLLRITDKYGTNILKVVKEKK